MFRMFDTNRDGLLEVCFFPFSIVLTQASMSSNSQNTPKHDVFSPGAVVATIVVPSYHGCSRTPGKLQNYIDILRYRGP